MGCGGSKSQTATTTDNPMTVAKPAETKVDPKSFYANYTLGEHLGKGKFAEVKKCTHSATKQVYAAKMLIKAKMDEEDLKALVDEVQIMQRIKHPNLISLVDFYDEEDVYILVQELATGGELFDRIVKDVCYSEEKARKYVKTLAQAVGYLHDNDIVHRDLKPQNILLDSQREDAELKVADFGFAKETEDSLLQTACGTPDYVAPEILQGKSYGSTVDCWSLGVIFYILLCGYPPFYGDNQTELYTAIKSASFEYDPEDWGHISAQAKDLIDKLLVVQPSQRLTCKQVLKHPWVVAGDLSTSDMGHMKSNLAKFNARRKLKASMNTVRSTVRMRMLMGAKSASRSETPTASGAEESKTGETAEA